MAILLRPHPKKDRILNSSGFARASGGTQSGENFLTVIMRAIESCKATGCNPKDSFCVVRETLRLGKETERVKNFSNYLLLKNLTSEMTNHTVSLDDLRGKTWVMS